MYNVSTKYREVVQRTSRSWDLYIDVVLKSGERLHLTRNNLDLGTLVFKDGATCSDTIQIGSVFSNSVSFRLINSKDQFTEHDFYLAKVFPYVGLDLTGKAEFEYVPLGEFNILDNVKKFSTITINGFDNMSQLNKTFDFSSIQFPTTPLVIFDAIVAQSSIQYREGLRGEIEALDYEISSLLTNEPTCRDVLAGFGLMLLKNFRFNRNGILEDFWYEPSGVTTTKNTRVGNSSYGDNQIVTTGVYLEDAYGNTFSTGTEEYAVELPSSPIIQGSDMALPILSAALEKLQLIQYRPASITWIGDPAVQAGDLITHEATAVGDLTLPVMQLVYKFASTETIQSLGNDSTTKSQESSTTKKLRRIFDRTNQNRTELETKIDQTEREILIQASERFTDKSDHAALAVKVDSLSAEVVRKVDGIQTQITSIEATSEEVSIAIQQIQNEGVDKVTTKVSKYTLNDEGLNISKAGEEMSNLLDNTGMHVRRGDEPILEASSAGVVATDVKVRNYLIVGNHSRFEDYNDGSDNRRTACFYVEQIEEVYYGLR